MSDILSQQEIDDLLKALNNGEINVNEIQEQTQEKKIKVYDFRRPNKFSKDQMRTLRIINENFARLMGSYLSGILRTYCDIDVISVEPQTYHEFNNSLPEPVILGIIDFKPLTGSIILEFSPGVVYGIIDRLLGGPGKVGENVREFTDIEIALINKIIKNLMSLMKDSWENVIDAEFVLERIETNAQFAQIVSPNETIAIITLNVHIGEIEGMINICIPHLVIEPIMDQLNTKHWFSSNLNTLKDTKKSEMMTNQIQGTELDLICKLGDTDITIRDFIELQKGDVIKLKRKVEEDVTIEVDQSSKFEGIVGLKNKNLAVQITRILGEEENDE